MSESVECTIAIVTRINLPSERHFAVCENLETVGDPLADFAYNAMMYRLSPDILGGIGGLDLAQLALPDEASYVSAYCRRTGREEVAGFDYYVVFNMFLWLT